VIRPPPGQVPSELQAAVEALHGHTIHATLLTDGHVQFDVNKTGDVIGIRDVGGSFEITLWRRGKRYHQSAPTVPEAMATARAMAMSAPTD